MMKYITQAHITSMWKNSLALKFIECSIFLKKSFNKIDGIDPSQHTREVTPTEL